MDDEPRIEAFDISEVERWLNDPEAPLAELMAARPFLKSEAGARRYLEHLKAGLDDARAGRTVPLETILQDVEERRRRFRPTAAE